MITKENDIYIILNMIEEIEPEVVIDIDMALARIGFVGRSFMKKSIPQDTKLLGVRCNGIEDELEKKATEFNVYEILYDKIIRSDEVDEKDISKSQSLAIVFNTRASKKDIDTLKPSWILLNNRQQAIDVANDGDELLTIDVEEDQYFFVKRLK